VSVLIPVISIWFAVACHMQAEVIVCSAFPVCIAIAILLFQFKVVPLKSSKPFQVTELYVACGQQNGNTGNNTTQSRIQGFPRYQASCINEAPKGLVDVFIEGDEAIYSAKDNCFSFDMQYADKLFGVFQRLHGVNEFQCAGSGLPSSSASSTVTAAWCGRRADSRKARRFTFHCRVWV
jgi:hypothetical protein